MNEAFRLCNHCVYQKTTAVFNLCMHPKSEYKFGDKEDFHTIEHMRTRGACGVDAVLLVRRVIHEPEAE